MVNSPSILVVDDEKGSRITLAALLEAEATVLAVKSFDEPIQGSMDVGP